MYLVAEDAIDLLWKSGRSAGDGDPEGAAEAEDGELTHSRAHQDAVPLDDGATWPHRQTQVHDMQFHERG
jgi:hypothetical protein